MKSTIGIIQSDSDFGEELTRVLIKDDHIVLPVAHSLRDAYKNFSTYNADIYIIDGQFPREMVLRLSDMFTLINVPHIVNYNHDLLLRKSAFNNLEVSNYATMLTEKVDDPISKAISLAVWEFHVSLQISKSFGQTAPAQSII
jgi:hypothetical protein